MAPSGKLISKNTARAPNSRITSRDNQWLKRFRAALAGERGADGLVGVEGVRLVEAALGSGFAVEALLVSDSGERHLDRLSSSLLGGRQTLRTSDRLFAAIADTQSPQGIAALIRPKQSTLENLSRGTPLIVVLVGVQDPGNVGTILRAAEAFGSTGAAACAAGAIGTADHFGPKALRASAGSAFRLPVVQGLPAADLLAQLRAVKIKLYAAVAASKQPEQQSQNIISSLSGPALLKPWEIDWKSAAALLIGNEGAGLPDDLIRSADTRVSIPQAVTSTAAGMESLNAAMAATVLLYEAMRQRDIKPNGISPTMSVDFLKANRP